MKKLFKNQNGFIPLLILLVLVILVIVVIVYLRVHHAHGIAKYP